LQLKLQYKAVRRRSIGDAVSVVPSADLMRLEFEVFLRVGLGSLEKPHGLGIPKRSSAVSEKAELYACVLLEGLLSACIVARL
jgi:hypothetical protein